MESPNTLLPLRRALISTFDKTGLLPLCEQLAKTDVEIISTGNTARFLRTHGFDVTDVEAITHFPEILGGRVKTLHPHIFSGILARRNLPLEIDTLNIHEIDTIDLVVVNLYPFEKTVAAMGATQGDCIENIDIGGPSLLRAAAKNFEYVAVLCDPSQYDSFISRYCEENGTYLEDRKAWAGAAFSQTARYDQSIATWMCSKPLRYGENPHQKARVFVSNQGDIPLAAAKPIQGKDLSYNNLLDAHAAITSLRSLTADKKSAESGCVVIKHGTPCGGAIATGVTLAAKSAFASDPTSAFGGIVALSGLVDEDCALELKPHFLELVIAPEFTPGALTIFGQKKDLRLLQIPQMLTAPWPHENMRSIFGGYLIQDVDSPELATHRMEVISKRTPCAEELKDLTVANHLAIGCLSNAITIVRNGQLIGVGAGQTSRIDAVKLAIAKAREHGHALEGASLASDGFFPFADGLQAAHEAGITSVIQPGGSKRDAEVIAKANELGLAMIFTQVRHFRH